MKNKSDRFPDLCVLRSFLAYSPVTGYLTWRVKRSGGANAGDVAGTVDGNGYIRIRIKGVDYRAHRLAWFHHYGVHPCEEIDHINRDKTDNRIVNLRDSDRTVNVLNRGKQVNNTTGCVGVNWRKDAKRWTSSITSGGRQQHLGYFDTFEGAVAVRKAAEAALGRLTEK